MASNSHASRASTALFQNQGEGRLLMILSRYADACIAMPRGEDRLHCTVDTASAFCGGREFLTY